MNLEKDEEIKAMNRDQQRRNRTIKTEDRSQLSTKVSTAISSSMGLTIVASTQPETDNSEKGNEEKKEPPKVTSIRSEPIKSKSCFRFSVIILTVHKIILIRIQRFK